MAKLSVDEKKWRAESDADTMARYNEIISDKSRMNAAIRAAKTRAAELSKSASRMSAVATRKRK